MPLTKCPDCGKEVSDLAPACPNCGRPALLAQPAMVPPQPTPTPLADPGLWDAMEVAQAARELELARQQNDRGAIAYYEKKVADRGARPKIAALKCPYCAGDRVQPRTRFTTGGIIVLLAGILLVPIFCVGLILILLSSGMREKKYLCQACGKEF